ncbi:unnamed protein product [Trifolium pratense]|uniref:Uncharacterized protein n=1 Tax=Trifolium pratense TaxID=57577 RepID=A0ACB0KR50_TRIPR|nr:unnamed protein product [Trifolium pratense]
MKKDLKQVMVLSSDVIKSEYDFRDYKIIRLRNGLQALIVHDPAISSKHKSEDEDDGKIKLLTAAVALTVGVGNLDSLELYGLPHLIEHVYSPKSEKFSEDDGSENFSEDDGIEKLSEDDESENVSKNDGFRDFIYEHGGYANACTYAEFTSYQFNIREKYLKAALERFANCLIEPVIEELALKKEVEIIDSEPLEVLQGWVLESFLGITKSPAKKVKVRKTKYLWMKPFPFCTKAVSQSKKRKRRLPRSDDEALVLPSNPPFIWTPGQKYYVKASDGSNILEVSWALPSLRKVYEHKPEKYVSYLLNQEGEGSLISLLKNKGWILSFKSRVGDFGIYRTSKDYIFIIEIHLTDYGLLEVNNIIGFLYGYLHFLRDSPQEWIFKEIQTIRNMKFNFKDENQLDYASRLSENMLFYPPEHIISANYVCKKWDEEMIKQVIGYLIPDNMRVDHLISDFTRKDDVQYVPWYETQYYVENIDETSMKLWRENQNFIESFKFPIENNFIPRDFSIHVGDTSNKENSTSLKCIADEQRMKFWYKKDIIFKIRRTSIFIRINFKEAHDTGKNSALSELFLSLLNYRLSEVKFKAKMSMCEITLRSLNGMLELNVFGFNGMLHKVLSEILFEVGSFKPADDIQYKVIKQDLERDLSNNGNHILELLLHEHLYMNGEMLRHLDQLLLDDFRSFIEDMRSQLFIEGLCHGSLTEEEANDICNIIKKNLQGNGLPIKSRYAAERVICLPSKANIVMSFRPASEIDTNSVAELYFQIGEVQSKSVKLPALLVLFDDVVRDGFFQKMRELENLGYTATSSITTRLKVVGYSFKIVSDKHDPYYLQDEMEKFIDHDLGKFLRDLDHQTFEDYKNSAAEELSGNFPSLKEESEDLWTSITIYRSEIFDVDKKMAEELRKARKKDLIEYYRKYFKSSYPDCRRVKINTVGYGKKMSDEEGKDMSYFKNKYDFYKC